MRWLVVLCLLAGCDCGAQSHERDATTDAPVTDTTTDDVLVCPGVLYHRPCGAPADPCASSCACRPDFVLEACNLDDIGSCLDSVTFCQAIENREFRSVDELECGLGPGGVELCNWRLNFFLGRFEWSHSDVVESGMYTCDGDTVTSPEYDGTWDGDRNVLTWDGIDYVMLDRSCPD